MSSARKHGRDWVLFPKGGAEEADLSLGSHINYLVAAGNLPLWAAQDWAAH